MPGAKEAVRAHDREAHRVLEPVADPFGLPLTRINPVQAGVGGDEERPVGGVDAESVHVHRPRVGGGNA
jgi:hypothetical protein